MFTSNTPSPALARLNKIVKTRNEAGTMIKDLFDEAVALATTTRQPAVFVWDNLTSTVEEGAKWEDFHGPFDNLNFIGRNCEVDGSNFTIKYAQPSKQCAA